jgi:hypothetical protein
MAIPITNWQSNRKRLLGQFVRFWNGRVIQIPGLKRSSIRVSHFRIVTLYPKVFKKLLFFLRGGIVNNAIYFKSRCQMNIFQVLVYKKSLRLAVGRRIAKTASQTNSKVSTLKNETRSQNNYNESTTQCEMTAQNITNESTSTTDAASKNVKNVENEDDDDSPANEGNLVKLIRCY